MLPLLVFIAACGTGRIESLYRQPDEAIVIAKVKLLDGKDNRTDEGKIFFGGANGVEPDDSGYVYFKVYTGKYYFARVQMGNESVKLPKTYTSFEIPESKIYYIGDITAYLNMEFNYGAGFGLLGALAYEGRHVRVPPVNVENNYEKDTYYFKNIFPMQDTIIPVIMRVDSAQLQKAWKVYNYKNKK